MVIKLSLTVGIIIVIFIVIRWNRAKICAHRFAFKSKNEMKIFKSETLCATNDCLAHCFLLFTIAQPPSPFKKLGTIIRRSVRGQCQMCGGVDPPHFIRLEN